MNSTALEKHYRVSELAELWGFSPGTLIKLFSDEPGVLKLQGLSGKRKYTTLSIPESVALRVHERLSHGALQMKLGGNPRRVVRLRELDAGVAKNQRNILKLKSGQQPPKSASLPQPVRPAVSDATPRS
jgi:hypothetical protein